MLQLVDLLSLDINAKKRMIRQNPDIGIVVLEDTHIYSAEKRDILGGKVNIFKLNNLYNYLKDNYMNKESKELFLLIKNASKNFESDSSKFVYIINYLNSKYSIYYVGKSKFLFRLRVFLLAELIRFSIR